MTTKTAGHFSDQAPHWDRHGHSVMVAVEAAKEAAGSVVTVLALPLPTGQVKLIARDEEGTVVFYTECPGADVGGILEILGVNGPEHDITELTKTFESDGLDFFEAARVAAVINASERCRA